jgi:3',5'-cyclic AMP phosphodiesterase CpdA
MTKEARLLHITDTHIKAAGGDLMLDDRKKDLGLDPQSKLRAMGYLLSRIAERLDKEGVTLDGVVFSGDALPAGTPGGDGALLSTLQEYLRIAPDRILAVPGNHDIPRDTSPGSTERYAQFVRAWRSAGCITPWLDGVDVVNDGETWRKHMLLGPENSWAVLAVNSCNWSHVEAVPKELKPIWNDIKAAAEAAVPTDRRAAVASAMQDLVRYDAAHVSDPQFEMIRKMLIKLREAGGGDAQLRMIALHHHVRAPSLREEIKPFADLINLERLRQVLAEQKVSVVFHGHKHVTRQQFDYIEHARSPAPHKVLIVAGGTVSESREEDAAALVHVRGLPWIPSVTVSTFDIPRPGLDLVEKPRAQRRIWTHVEADLLSPIVIQGRTYDEVYAKVCECSQKDVFDVPLVVQLDDPSDMDISRLPKGYPVDVPGQNNRTDWLRELVGWWQQSESELLQRLPYLHGHRLHRYSNNIDQIDRVIKLLRKKNTSRAIAILVDPRLDFHESPPIDFASFCLVQFARRTSELGTVLDVTGYYRAQEMIRWWPINIAELRYLQRAVGNAIKIKPGRITTIAAVARVDSRSPTHVAVPLIDRWLDQHPENYFKLATALLSGKLPADDPLADVWIEELEALKLAAQHPPRDGGPVVAIEGFRRLATYLRAGSGANFDRCQELSDDLQRLARDCERGPANETMDVWTKAVVHTLDDVIAKSKGLLTSQR